MARQPRKLHGVSPRDTLDRAAFILAFVFGAGGSIFLKVLGVHPFIAAGYAALILVLYAVSAWAGGRIKLEPETIGDNCYYLGFLFTLTSLSYTLYQMSTPNLDSGNPVNIPAVISGFGVALSSTIFGVFLRVLLMQLRPDFVAKDREVRADINRAFGDFRKNMSGILRQMKAFSAESVQLASERDERIRKSTEGLVKHQYAIIEETSKLFAANLEETLLKTVEETTAKVEAAIAETSKQSQEALEASVAEIRDAKTSFVEQELKSLEELQARRNQMVAEMSESARQMKEHSEEMEKYIRVTRRTADAMTKRIVPALDEFKERLDNLPEEPKVEDATYNLSEEMADLASVVDKPFTVKPTRGPWTRKKADGS
jgi:hypothetical protein